MRLSIKYLLGLFVAGLLLASCEYHVIEPLDTNIPDGQITFNEHILPILQAKCASCHASTSPVMSEAEAYNNLYNGGYIDLTNPEASTIYVKTEGGHPGGNNALSANELALLLAWIEQGANEE